MPITPTEQVKRSPNWQDYMQQVLGHTGDRAGIQMFPEGTKTMRHKEMDSANVRHSQSIAQQDRSLSQQYLMHSEDMALRKWIAEENKKLAWAEFNAVQSASELTNPLGLLGDDNFMAAYGGTAASPAPHTWDKMFSSNTANFSRPEFYDSQPELSRKTARPEFYDWGQHTPVRK